MPKKPPLMVKASAPEEPCGILSGVVPTTAGRVGESSSWHFVGSGEQSCWAPPWRAAVKTREWRWPEAWAAQGRGMRTRSVVPLSSVRMLCDGSWKWLMKMLVVEMKFVPVS